MSAQTSFSKVFSILSETNQNVKGKARREISRRASYPMAGDLFSWLTSDMFGQCVSCATKHISWHGIFVVPCVRVFCSDTETDKDRQREAETETETKTDRDKQRHRDVLVYNGTKRKHKIK